jgi:predicted nuclease of predicted toxin-antitoxin system
VRLLADLNIAPRSATFLRSLGHDLIRVNEVLPGGTSDEEIVEFARAHGYAVLTQDLDFSAIVALSGASTPSIISVRLGSARVEAVNRRLESCCRPSKRTCLRARSSRSRNTRCALARCPSRSSLRFSLGRTM